VSGIVTILVALLVCFIAFKVLMGLVRVAAVLLIFAVVAGMYSQGVLG
jgi:hypothetical protein